MFDLDVAPKLPSNAPVLMAQVAGVGGNADGNVLMQDSLTHDPAHPFDAGIPFKVGK